MDVERKKESLKKLRLVLKKGMLSKFLVAYAWFSGISLKSTWSFCFCKEFLVFCTNVVTEVILNLILDKVFP